MNKYGQGLLLILLSVSIIVFSGCAGGGAMKKTEPGYMPSYVALGEIMAYTAGVSTVKYSDLVRMTEQNINKQMRTEGVKFLTLKEMENPSVPDDKIVLLDMELSFQAGMRSMTEDSYNIQITYTLKRKSDGLVWGEGSARSTDEAVSQGAALDLTKAIEFATLSTVKRTKKLFEE